MWSSLKSNFNKSQVAKGHSEVTEMLNHSVLQYSVVFHDLVATFRFSIFLHWLVETVTWRFWVRLNTVC